MMRFHEIYNYIINFYRTQKGFWRSEPCEKKSINWNWHWATVFPWILTSKFLGCGHGSKVLRPVDPWFAYRSSCVYRPIFGAGVSYLDSYNARAVASGDQFSCILMCAKDIQSPLGVHYISEPEMTRPPLVSLGQQKMTCTLLLRLNPRVYPVSMAINRCISSTTNM